MKINDVNKDISKNRRRKRVGRGPGSGCGKTSSRGHKGQKSRSGYSRSPVFQGGAMPLVRRVPKRGFNNKFAQVVATINISKLEAKFEANEEVSPETLKQKHIVISRYDELKILGDGELTKALKVSAHRFSKSAKEKIEKAGGEVVVLPGKTPVSEKQQKAKQGDTPSDSE